MTIRKITNKTRRRMVCVKKLLLVLVNDYYLNQWWPGLPTYLRTVYPKKYAHGFVVLCFVVVMQSFIMDSHEVFIHIHQGCFAGTGAIVRLPQCQWSKPDGYGKISQCITTTKHSKAKTVCIFLGIYCITQPQWVNLQQQWQRRAKPKRNKQKMMSLVNHMYFAKKV